MAGLANRVPIVTNLGDLSEPLWSNSSAVSIVPSPDPASLTKATIEVLALSPKSRRGLGDRGAELYFRVFSLERTVSRLRAEVPSTFARSLASS